LESFQSSYTIRLSKVLTHLVFGDCSPKAVERTQIWADDTPHVRQASSDSGSPATFTCDNLVLIFA
jgi:hypothetical protein